MKSENSIQIIKKRLLVNTSPKRAYEVFTKQIDLWWPRSHHIGKTPMTKMVLEPQVGGRWFSIHEDGTECNVGKVLIWDPPSRLMLAWQIDANWKYVPSLITDVEVKFIPDGSAKTIVEFEHRDLDRLGEGGKQVASMDAGWGMILDLYSKIAEQ
jgi:uncharacterized protein YndB with AHSA1/START domain